MQKNSANGHGSNAMEVDESQSQPQQEQQQQHQQAQTSNSSNITNINVAIEINKLKTYAYPLLNNVYEHLPLPPCVGSTHLMRGSMTYFHYGCDGYNDSGWGCAYRTLQSLCSWVIDKRHCTAKQHLVKQKKNKQQKQTINVPIDAPNCVPSIIEIQRTLTHIGDKSEAFVGSHEWIGALEVFFVVDTLYDVPCKILHVPQREDLKKYANVLKRYFEEYGGFVMMGGDIDMDASSKGIAGVHISGNQAYFLIVDPHFVGVPHGGAAELIERGYIRWQHSGEFNDSSFYNLCLPQLK